MNFTRKKPMKPIKKLEDQLDYKLIELERNLNTLNFEEMGCDTMGCINQMKPKIAQAKKEIEEYKRGKKW